MGYFNELPEIAYQSPLSHKNSSRDYVIIKNIFRRVKLLDYLKDATSLFNKFIIGDGDRPDTVAEILYGDSRLDYVVILVAGITNINHEWPLQDYQIYDYALSKYKTEEEMMKVRHYETFEIRDSQNRQILPPNLIVDADFKIYGSSTQVGSVRYNLISQAGNRQLDDKTEYTVATDNIARAVTNLEFEHSENEKKREIDVLNSGYLQSFINDFRDIVKYDKNSNYITSSKSIIHKITNVDEFLQNVRKKHRYSIKQSEKNNFIWEALDNIDGINYFLDTYKVMSATKNLKLSLVDLKKFREFNNSKFKLISFCGLENNICLASCIVSVFNKKAFYHYAATTDLGRDKSASYGMIYNLMKYLQSIEVEELDFGGLSEDGSSSGVDFFKEGFNGEVVNRIGEFDIAKSNLYRYIFNKVIQFKSFN